jgi:hypothetical protein
MVSPGRPLAEVVQAVTDALDADIIMYAGEIGRPYDTRFHKCCVKYRERPNVLLLLTTFGGNPDAGYRMARWLQQLYVNG